MSNLRDKLIGSIDCVLKIREEMGAQKADVFIVERKWTGHRVGDGVFKDTVCRITPTPEIRDFSHDIRLQEAGSYKSGDLILRSISLKNYTEEQLRTDTGIETMSKYIKVGNHFYRTIHVKENIATWDIHIRKVSEDETERD